MNTKFFCKLGKSAAETLVGLGPIYGDKAFKKSAVWIIFFNISRKFLVLAYSFWYYTVYSYESSCTELWPHSLWDPLYTPAAVDSTLYSTPAMTEEVQAAPVSVWGSLMNSVWSSSPWSTGAGSVVPPISAPPGPLVPLAPIPTRRQEVAHNINEDVAADIDVSVVCLKHTWSRQQYRGKVLCVCDLGVVILVSIMCWKWTPAISNDDVTKHVIS